MLSVFPICNLSELPQICKLEQQKALKDCEPKLIKITKPSLAFKIDKLLFTKSEI